MQSRRFRDKLKSCKFLVTIWAMGLITYIVVAGLTDFLQLCTVLAAAPLAYTAANVYQKKIYSQENDNGLQ